MVRTHKLDLLIMLLSVVTANIAAFFVEEGPEDDGPSDEVLRRLERIEKLLQQR